METSPVAYYRHSPIPPMQRRTKAPQFGGPGDMVSAGVGFIDSNRFFELVFSDLFAMIFPRTAIAKHERGTDDARETFIREFSGLVGNMFVVGWASQLAVAALGSWVNAYNPHGIPAKAWVSSANMDTFSQLYKASLNKENSAADARRHFVQTILSGLEAGDKNFSIEGRLGSLQKLAPADRATALRQMVETVHGTSEAKRQFPQYQALLNDGKTDELRDMFLKNWGRLSSESQAALAKYYDQANGLKRGIKGTHNFDAATERQLYGELAAQTKDKINAFEAKLASLKADKPEEFAKRVEIFKQQLFAKHRLDLSLADLGKPTEQFEKAIGQEALERGLTGTIHLRNLKTDTPETRAFLSKGQSRNTLLKELKFFLEQYVDRASYGADRTADWKQQKLHIEGALFKNSKQGLLHPVWPSIEDGLITATRKSKFMYTAVPMVTAICTAGAFTFFNQWLTKRKHGGKVFFPGEMSGIPTNKTTTMGSAPPQPLAFASRPSPPYTASSAAYRPPYSAPSHPLREGILA